jgi:murein L,D-transpeptidase YcbB/YkuD
MLGGRVLLLVAVAALASGCAGGRQYRSELARLQSQVGLLDERVTQLERSGVGPLMSAPINEPAFGATSVGAEAPIRAPAAPKSASFSKAGGLSGTPSTRDIQQALKNAGFYQGAVDGKMGAMTREAIREFQRINGLKDDGVVGRQTWAKLSAYADLSSTQQVLK